MTNPSHRGPRTLDSSGAARLKAGIEPRLVTLLAIFRADHNPTTCPWLEYRIKVMRLWGCCHRLQKDCANPGQKTGVARAVTTNTIQSLPEALRENETTHATD